MPAFFKEIEMFRGDGSNNEKGQSLEEFLDQYDPYKYKNPCCTVDMAVFAYSGEVFENMEDLKILLIKRRNHPSIGDWAMPGGFVELHESLEEAAQRELYEETGVNGICSEQIGTFGDVMRDPRARVITTAYMALVPEKEIKIQAGDDAKEAEWFRIKTERKKENGMFVFKMVLQNEKTGEKCSPIVTLCERGRMIRERKFAIAKRDHVAADHASIILQAYLILEQRLKERHSEKEKTIHEME